MNAEATAEFMQELRNAPLSDDPTWEAVKLLMGTVIELKTAVESMKRELTEARAAGWKGVWSPVGEYRRGEMASRFGTLWHCNNTGTKQAPGTGDDWSLMVKTTR